MAKDTGNNNKLPEEENSNKSEQATNFFRNMDQRDPDDTEKEKS